MHVWSKASLEIQTRNNILAACGALVSGPAVAGDLPDIRAPGIAAMYCSSRKATRLVATGDQAVFGSMHEAIKFYSG